MPINITSLNGLYQEMFDGLGNSGQSSTLPEGWAIAESGTASNVTYNSGTGSANTGDTYSFGAAGSTDRALGSLQSGALIPIIGSSFTNATSSTITSLLVSYIGEQWRLGTVGRADRIDFQISFDATSLTTGTWTNVDSLDFSSPVTTGAVGALDGNAAANRTAISSTISDLNIAPGATFWIRWTDFNASGADDGLAIDNFQLTAQGVTGSAGALSIDSPSINEGDTGLTNITFTVTRSGGSTGAVAATWNASFGSGAGNADATDFDAGQLFSGIVNFADGETSRTITLAVAGDIASEPNETFTVTLSAPTDGATIATASGTGTILNDEPQATLSIADATISEGNTGTTPISFVVTRAGDAASAVSADYAVTFGSADAADFAGGSVFTGTVAFAAGETSKTITLNVAGDIIVEANETFTVTLSNPSVGALITDASATGTITNDDTAPVANVWVNEINYDPTGTDANEFIEIAGVAGTNLTGWSLVLYNGNGGAVYSTLNLSGILSNATNGFGFIKVPATGLQNGSPDGIALVDNTGRVVQFLSYEGPMTAVSGPAAGLTSTDIGVLQENAPLGFTLQLSGSGSSYADFTWQANVANTEGALNEGQSFLSSNDPGQIRILDASVAEGNVGEATLTFTVRRAGGTALTSDVAYTVNLDGTADAADLGAGALLSGTVQFAIGETVKTITIPVHGDLVGEFNETLSVTLTSATNATIVDGTATGTIINDDPLALAIYQIQGEAHLSAFAGQNVTTTGIVTAVDTNGFYLQDATGDGNGRTSDAIFVFTNAVPAVAVGDAANVTGIVAEQRPGNNLENLTTTQINSPAVTVLSSGNTLPASTLIGTGGVMPPSDVFDNDQFAVYDPENDAADFYESLEGMRVTIDAPLVTSPTNDFGETYVVASGGVGATGVNSRGGITIAGNDDGFDDYNPERIQLDDDSGLFAGYMPNYTQGDRLSSVTGVVSYNFQNYEVLVTEAVTITTDVGALPRETTELQGTENRLSIATYNVENLDPGDNKFDILAGDIVYNLGAPDIISLEEIQDADGAGTGSDLSGYVTAQLLIDAMKLIGGPDYVYIEVTPTTPNSTGGEPGGNIRNGFLYNADRVDYVDGSAVAVPGAAFNGSRSPLAAQFVFNGETITAISVHSTSRGGSDPLFGANQPPANAGEAARIAQSTAISAYVTNLLNTDPDAYVAVLGDFNAFYFEDSLELVENGVLTNLHRTLPEEERYSYVFEGNAQAIDHILVSNNLLANAQFDAVHINSEQPDTPSRATDHDPLVATLLFNSAAVAQSGVATGDEDVVITGTLVATDKNDDVLTYSIVTGPTNGTVVLGTDGTYTYTPNADYNGPDSFTFKANDGVTDSGVATVSLTVNAVNDAVVLANDLGVVDATEDAAFSLNIAGNFTDVDNATLAYSTSTLPAWLSFDAVTGQFSGTPANGDVGSYVVTVTASDGSTSVSDTFSINVGNVNDAPTDIALDATTVAENAANGATVATATATDPDAGDTKSFSLVDNAGGRFAINAATGVISVANSALLNFEAATAHAITVRVTDAAGASYDEVFTINVTDVNEAPDSLILASGGSVAENSANGTAVAQLAATDPDAGTTLSYSLVDNAGGRFAIDAATGVVTVANGSLLDFESATSHNLIARITDQGGLSRDLAFTVNVTDVAEGPPPINGSNGFDLIFGTNGNDVINALGGEDIVFGDSGNDNIFGGSGRDSLNGGSGNDILIGGGGADLLSGGSGQDIFRYTSVGDAPRATGIFAALNRETILDFNSSNGANHDLIDLSAIDANINVAGDQGFAFIGSSAFSGVAGQLRYSGGVLQADVNGDRIADLEIFMVSAPPLDRTDFVL